MDHPNLKILGPPKFLFGPPKFQIFIWTTQISNFYLDHPNFLEYKGPPKFLENIFRKKILENICADITEQLLRSRHKWMSQLWLTLLLISWTGEYRVGQDSGLQSAA